MASIIDCLNVIVRHPDILSKMSPYGFGHYRKLRDHLLQNKTVKTSDTELKSLFVHRDISNLDSNGYVDGFNLVVDFSVYRFFNKAVSIESLQHYKLENRHNKAIIDEIDNCFRAKVRHSNIQNRDITYLDVKIDTFKGMPEKVIADEKIATLNISVSGLHVENFAGYPEIDTNSNLNMAVNNCQNLKNFD